MTEHMEDKNLAKLRKDIRMYQEIMDHYRDHPLKMKANMEYLSETQVNFFNLCSLYPDLLFEDAINEPLVTLVLANQENLTKLLGSLPQN